MITAVPTALEANRAVALLLPFAIVTVPAPKLPTAGLLLLTATVTVLPPETLWASVNAVPDVRPVSMTMFASGPLADEVKLVAPIPPGEVMRNPVGARFTGLLLSVVKLGIETLVALTLLAAAFPSSDPADPPVIGLFNVRPVTCVQVAFELGFSALIVDELIL